METATLLEVLGSLQPVRMLVEPRLDLNNPPTTVGWDSESPQRRFFYVGLEPIAALPYGGFRIFEQRPPEPGGLPQRRIPLR